MQYKASSRGQILKTTKSSIIYTLKQFKIKIKAGQLLIKQLSKIAPLYHFPSSTPIKPRSGCRHPSLNLEYPWSWLAVGYGLPCNDFVWPVALIVCSLLSLYVSVRIKVFSLPAHWSFSFILWDKIEEHHYKQRRWLIPNNKAKYETSQQLSSKTTAHALSVFSFAKEPLQ